MKQPLILTAEQRRTCALAIIARDPAITSMHASVDERTIAWAIGLHSEAIALATQGHELLLALIKAAGWSRTAAQILADVAFGVGPEDAERALNLELAPASE